MTQWVHHRAPTEDEQAASWCHRFDEGDLDAFELDAFQAWLETDPDNLSRFEEATVIWHGIADAANAPDMIRYRAEAVEMLRRENARRWSRRIDWWKWGGIAASIILMFGVAAYLLRDPSVSYNTGVGERRIVQLEDGTRVTLDGSTRVKVEMDGHSRRLTLLSGRAKFDVAHDPLRPLSVLARNRLTVATGTSFSVELLPGQMRVALYEGRVEIMAETGAGAPRTLLSATSNSPTALVPGRELIASTASTATQVAPLDVPQSLSWESGMLHFKGDPLALAVERMNRNAKRALVIDDPRVARFPISGAFNGSDTDAFVEGISALHPIVASQEGGRIILRLKTDAK